MDLYIKAIVDLDEYIDLLTKSRKLSPIVNIVLDNLKTSKYIRSS